MQGELLVVDQKYWTYEDLKAMPETLDKYEIIDGVLYMSPSSHVARHQRTVANLLYLLRNYVVERGLGEVFIAPADVVLAHDRVLQPDVFFIARDRLAMVDAAVEGVPDLVVEVLSSSTATYDRTIKFRVYEEAGVRECWLVDPVARTVEVFAREGEKLSSRNVYATGDRLASTVFVELSAQVAEVFAGVP